ncbi:MAG: hypothetical protein ACOX8B_04755 [Lachnospiraceae bacterium]|jgi:hypothetical protein
MAINPMQMMKLKERMDLFNREHPKMQAFLADVSANAVQEGSVVEFKVTRPDGKTYVSNIRLTADDMETLSMLKKAK